MDEKTCVLRVRGLEKSFDGDPVLRGIDLDVYQGDVISVIGPQRFWKIYAYPLH